MMNGRCSYCNVPMPGYPDAQAWKLIGAVAICPKCQVKPPLALSWDKLHPQSRQEMAHGVLQADYAATVRWADIPAWLQDNIRTDCLCRSHGKVTVAA